jgi:hypothetical protein
MHSMKGNSIMSWTNRINGNPIDWLINSPIPEIHYLTGRDLMDLPDSDPQQQSARREAYTSGTIATVLSKMEGDGYWQKPGPGYGPKYKSTVWAVSLLAQLGARVDGDPRVEQACQYVLDHTMAKHGQMSYNGQPSGTIDCLQGNLCRALLAMGCTDARLDLALDWMSRTVTGEGIAPITEKKAEQRYYVYKCGPGFLCGANNKLPCAWGAAKVMYAFSEVPSEKWTTQMQVAIQQGVEFFFSVDPVSATYPTASGGKPNGDWWKFGFPVFYITDLLQVADALTALGYGNDPRLQSTVNLILQKQDEQGRWSLEYRYGPKTWGNFGKGGMPNEWVTLRASRVLKRIPGL